MWSEASRWATMMAPTPWVLYFTSEAEAREGERKEVPPELQATMDEMNKISTGEPEFFDLRQPLILSPQ